MENKVSLILTTYNEEGNIENCLRSVFKQSKIPDEIIIVDGGSTDQTAKVIEGLQKEYSQIKLFVNPKFNRKNHVSPIAAGRNFAISQASGDVIASFDAGTELCPAWLEEITKPFINSDVDVVAGWYEPMIKNFVQKIYAEIIFRKLKKLNQESFLPSSRSIAFKKDAWSKAGKYPELIFAAEDTLFDINLKKIGAKFFFNPKAIVYWEPRETIKKTLKQFFIYSYSDAYSKISTRAHLYLGSIYLISLLSFLLGMFLSPYYLIGLFISFVYFSYIVYKQELYTIKKFLYIPFYIVAKISVDLAKIVGFSYGLYLLALKRVK